MINVYRYIVMKDINADCPTCGAKGGEKCRNRRTRKPIDSLHEMRRLISINHAVSMGIERIRKPAWANDMDHIKIDIIDGELGPWVHVYSPYNLTINGVDPVDIIIGANALVPIESLDSPEFIAYRGYLPGSKEYKDAQKEYKLL